MMPELGQLAAHTRDDPRYWQGPRPHDHNGVGLFMFGPQPARPWWFLEVKTGSAHTAPSVETREAVLAREAEAKRARLRRMNLGVTGAFTGRNRKAA
jgi:hypothetical protein